ncbi:MAG: hypothetical protein WDM96_17900 [Lacunisphaera sp.]
MAEVPDFKRTGNLSSVVTRRRRGSRTHFGALLVGYYARGRLLYAGKVGTGFDRRKLAELHARFGSRAWSACPFANLPATNRPRFRAKR